MEDCIIEQPYTSNARETTCIVAVGGPLDLPDGGGMRHLPIFAGEVRNCYINTEYVNPRSGNPEVVTRIVYPTYPEPLTNIYTRFPHNVKQDDYIELITNVLELNKRWKVVSITGSEETSTQLKINIQNPPAAPSGPMSMFKSEQETLPVVLTKETTVVKVETGTRKHNRVAGNEVIITGADQEGYNGTFPMIGPVTDYSFYYQPASMPSTNPTGETWIDRIDFQRARFSAVAGGGVAGQEVTMTTYGPHYRKTGQWVFIGGVTVNGSTANAYNNYVKITAVPTPTTFKYLLPADAYGTLGLYPDAMILVNFQGISANGGFGGGMFSNRIANTQKAGTYQDYFLEREAIIKHNYCYNTYLGCVMNFAPVSSYNPINGTVSVTNGIATVTASTASADYGFPVGSALWFQKNGVNYDVLVFRAGMVGNYFVYSFKVPAGVAFGTQEVISAKLWYQHRDLIYKDNIIELALFPKGSASAGPQGVVLTGAYWTVTPAPPLLLRSLNDPWFFGNVEIDGNLIRKVGGVDDPNYYAWAGHCSVAIQVLSVENLIIRNNVFPNMNSLITTGALRHWIFKYAAVKNLKIFNNQTPGGKLWQLYADERFPGKPGSFVEELETQADDFLLFWKK